MNFLSFPYKLKKKLILNLLTSPVKTKILNKSSILNSNLPFQGKEEECCEAGAGRLVGRKAGLQVNPPFTCVRYCRNEHQHLRSFVKYSRRLHDLTQIDSNPPFYSHNCATLYSREFYDLCRSRLAPGGMFTQVLPVKQLTRAEMQSILHTFAAVFPHVLLWWNDLDPLMIGSNTPFRLDPTAIAERLERPAIKAALKQYSGEAKYDSLGHFLSGLLLTDEGFRSAGAGGRLNTVDKNHLEYSSAPEADIDNIPLLQQYLCAWDDATKLLRGQDIFRTYNAGWKRGVPSSWASLSAGSC